MGFMFKILDEIKNLENILPSLLKQTVTSGGLKFSSAKAGGKKLGSPPTSL